MLVAASDVAAGLDLIKLCCRLVVHRGHPLKRRDKNLFQLCWMCIYIRSSSGVPPPMFSFSLFCVIYLRPCRLIAFKRPASREDRKKKGASREQRAVPMKARQMPTFFFLSLSLPFFSFSRTVYSV